MSNPSLRRKARQAERKTESMAADTENDAYERDQLQCGQFGVAQVAPQVAQGRDQLQCDQLAHVAPSRCDQLQGTKVPSREDATLAMAHAILNKMQGHDMHQIDFTKIILEGIEAHPELVAAMGSASM